VVRRGSGNLGDRFFNDGAQGALSQLNTSIAPASYGAGAMCFEGTREDTSGRRMAVWLRLGGRPTVDQPRVFSMLFLA